MSAAQDRHLSPAEVARRMGLSPKALRLYETHGLVAPLRSQSGWRAYGAGEIARLHQIQALKRLGFSLARIADLLARRPVALETLLAAQEEMLAREQVRVDRALNLVRAARGKLAGGQTLSIDDLIQLTKETTMTTQQQHEEMKGIFDPLAEKHMTKEELERLRKRSFDQREQGVWDELMAEAKDLMAKGDPTSPQAKDLARRWTAQVNKFTQGDPAIAAKVKAMWQEAMADPKAAPKLPLNPEIFAFVEKAWKAAQASDAK
ncbi:MAG: MerR family transcriptional regulator [Rhizomicrobium sp.]